MADEMNGIEKRRKLSDDAKLTPLWECLRIERRRDWSASSILDPIRLKDALSEIADQIEREHVEAINAKIETICTFAREVDRLKEGAGRDLTGEAREAVERLRAIPHEDVLRSANPDFIIVNELCKAVGVDRRPTYTGTLDAVCDRLVELIEHGGGQGADVAALRKLADEMEEMSDYNRMMWEVTGDSAHHGACCALSSYPQRIRDAVDGAPKPDAEREAAADWVAEQGGLDIVRDYPMMDEFVAALATDLGVSDDIGCGDDLRDAIRDELDERLMPPDCAWPRWDDGKPLREDDAPDGVTVVSLYLDGSGYGLADAILDHQAGDYVKRPEPEALGADGKPIREGDTVYLDDGHAGMAGQAGYDGNWSYGLIGVETGEALTVARVDSDTHAHLAEHGAWCPASWLTHDAPDTQERIDDDATLDPATYCDDVLGWDAEKIVHHSDYAAQNEAMIADLLRRQRELDAKTTGGAR